MKSLDSCVPATIAGYSVRIPPVSWAGRIADFDRGAFGRDAWPESLWRDELDGAERTYLLLEDEPDPLRSLGEIVAVGGVSYYDDAEILTIAVSPHFRRRGIGHQLLAALLKIAEFYGAKRAFLEVRAAHKGVQKMYADAGFRQIAVRKRYYSDDDAVVMLRES